MIPALSFYILSISTLGFAFKVVTTPNILRGAIYLIATLLSVAGIYLLLGAELLAAIQILVYVGGIVVITIFAVFLTSRLGEPAAIPLARVKSLALFSGLSLAALLLFGYITNFSLRNTGSLEFSQTTTNSQAIGRLLLSSNADGFLLPFEIVSVLLLAALIGAVVVARSKPEDNNV